MNKKVLFSLIFIISFSCIWAVWEGNGGIGSPTDFPSEGLFVRSDMFPKHTLLEITNLEKNVKARAVVIGPSGIPGLLVSLSPELGEKLNVPRGKVIRIRVLTPSPVNEDDGKSVSAGPESQDLDTNPALFVASHSDLPNTNLKKEENKPVSENTDGDTILYDEVENPVDETENPETVEAVPAVEEVSIAEELPPAEPPIENTATAEEVPNVEAILDPVVEEPEEVEPIAETYMEPANENPPITVDPITEPAAKPEAAPAPVTEVSEPQEPEQTQEVVESVEVVDPVVEPVYTALAEEKTVDSIASASPKNVPMAEKKEEEAAPVEEIPAEEDTGSYDEADSDIYNVASEEKIEESSIAILNEPKTVSSKLEKGKTYVQIVVYNDKYNRDEVVKKYGKNYPIVIEESFVKNNTRYTIFIGPLQPQETGAVLERFKQLGFKDAFLRKGK
ncbi:SPOR domain-containing protein [Treponema sp. OMZ 792]|uniref:SPOR domain-containing protein n=1 Tax=unclassified Treponema TaxID=2638727 RepID=UPI0020A23589|nr:MULTISPECIES: SPOR domain-containing protein [unclassified Treponema]UTC74121.1 SPOR domain-containing protein [Treponema sp. OMZ 792]UTC80521.1 SPOR domain-containing protein [Treponema sp. OMZ 798]